MAESRNVKVTIEGTTEDLQKKLKISVNGILDHELSVGDAGYIKPENRIILPLDIELQYKFALVHTKDPKKSMLLAVGRLGILSYWGTFLTGVDREEAVARDVVAGMMKVVKADGRVTITVADSGIHEAKRVFPDATVSFSDLEWEGSTVDLEKSVFRDGYNYNMVFLHMKDVGMAVAQNLVRTGHHYQVNTAGTFKALERKRFTREFFQPDERDILYHEVMHCFTQIGKLAIYYGFLAAYNAENVKTTVPFNILDTVILKRLPVVPAGAAWLSAGITVMNELLSVPSMTTKIPPEYSDLLKDANTLLQKIMKEGKVDTFAVTRFEGLAAFAFGALREIAPTHSAALAPSLKKMAEQHLGATTAGADIARAALRGV